jgi:anaerobic magnesium-protoporphyrin IX monomethyl ester cyclase
MKVLLINPSKVHRRGAKGVRLGLPLGLMYIAAVLEKNSVPVKIFDSLISDNTRITEYPEYTHHGVSSDYLKQIVDKESPDIVGITSPFTSQIENTIQVARLIKEISPNIFVVAGGPHFSVRGRQFLEENPEVDVVVAGEGEIAMLELVKALENKSPYNNIKGLIFRSRSSQNGVEIKNNRPELIKDLDSLPLPAYHLVDMERYFHFLGKGLSSRPGKYSRSISMITSRGCPYNCIFCSIHLHMGRLWRAHSADYVFSHISQVVHKYGVRHISFEDDNFTFNPQRCEDIINQILESNLNIGWDTPNGVRADTLNEGLLKKMKQSGCQKLIVAAESGDQETLDKIIHKSLKLENIIRVAHWCKKLKIKLESSFVIGFPGETKAKIQKTIDFAFRLYKKFDVKPDLLFATPLIGTKLYEIVVKKKYLAEKVTPSNLAVATQARGKGMIRTKEFCPKDLKNFSQQLESRMARLDLVKKMTDPREFFKSLKLFLSKPNRILFYFKRLIGKT